jgi:hypothetical protein
VRVCSCAQAEKFAQAQVDAAASRSTADQLTSLHRLRLVVSFAARADTTANQQRYALSANE